MIHTFEQAEQSPSRIVNAASLVELHIEFSCLQSASGGMTRSLNRILKICQ